MCECFFGVRLVLSEVEGRSSLPWAAKGRRFYHLGNPQTESNESPSLTRFFCAQ